MALLVLLVITTGPGLLSESAAGIFVKTLATKLGTTMPKVNGSGGAALSHDGSYAVELGYLGGAFEALPIRTKGNQKPRSQAGTSSGQTAEDLRVRVLVHGFFDLLVQLGDHSVQRFEHG